MQLNILWIVHTSIPSVLNSAFPPITDKAVGGASPKKTALSPSILSFAEWAKHYTNAPPSSCSEPLKLCTCTVYSPCSNWAQLLKENMHCTCMQFERLEWLLMSLAGAGRVHWTDAQCKQPRAATRGCIIVTFGPSYKWQDRGKRGANSFVVRPPNNCICSVRTFPILGSVDRIWTCIGGFLELFLQFKWNRDIFAI